MSSRNNRDQFFENSPRSDRSCDSPKSPKCRSPCKEKYFTEKAGRALTCEVEKNKHCDIERFHSMQEEIDCLKKQFRCFRDDACRQIKALEVAACEQRKFDKRSLIEIDNLRCCIENMRARQLMAERGNVCALELTQAEINRERFAQTRERIVRTENEAFLADRVAGLEVAAGAAAAAQNAPGMAPAVAAGAAVAAATMPIYPPMSPARVAAAAYGPYSPIGDRFGLPCGPMGLNGNFRVGVGCDLNGPGYGPYGYGPGVGYPGCGPVGWDVPCGNPNWNDCGRGKCDTGSCSPRRC